MSSERIVVKLDSPQQRLMVNGLVDYRNRIQKKGESPEDVEDLILKVIDASAAKGDRTTGR